jgi:hypothetical protein
MKALLVIFGLIGFSVAQAATVVKADLKCSANVLAQPGDGVMPVFLIQFSTDRKSENINDDGTMVANVSIEGLDNKFECALGDVARIGNAKFYPVSCANEDAIILVNADLKTATVLFKAASTGLIGANVNYKCVSNKK